MIPDFIILFLSPNSERGLEIRIAKLNRKKAKLEKKKEYIELKKELDILEKETDNINGKNYKDS